MVEAAAFYILAALILGFAALVITAKNTVHSVLFLVADFLCVAALYVTLRAPFLAVIQVMVYAGGIVVLYLFVVMLVNLKRPPEAHSDPRRLSRLGVVMAAAVLAELVAIFAVGWAKPAAVEGTLSAQNVEQIGRALYTDYLIPFELASFLLLVAMIGAIILAKREL
ncbi:MAG TPA: NADH-quinone oxidoreductase subunit J [Vicinamibacterales bacterium]|nr:NADH-quinone oxidoreductase subunit J [Vicinamibacterales bacterium]